MMSLLTKIINLCKRGFVSNSLQDDKDSSIAQITYFGKTGISEIVSPYGLSSRLPVGTQTLTFSVQGQENNRASIGYSQEDRFKNLLEGEVVVGNPKTGASVKFSIDGSIIINPSPTGSLIINSNGDLSISANGDIKLKATGEVDVDATRVNLGTGGPAIARVGDSVLVGTSTGTITSGGSNTSL